MAQPQPARTEQARPKSRARAGEGVYAYAVKGDAAKVLAAWKLPRGARVAIIPMDATVEAELRRAGGNRIARYGRVEADPANLEETATKVGESAFEPDARARALLRGVEIAEADLARAGGAFDLRQVQKIMHGVSRQRIERRVQERSLLAVPGPGRRRRYPTVQFHDDGTVVQGLNEVRSALRYSSPWAVLNFLIRPDDLLAGEAPVDLLRRGEVARVVESARRIGVQAA
jgi:hypothetical protein